MTTGADQLDNTQSPEGVMTKAYGQRFGEALRVKNAPAIVTRSLRTAEISVTEIRCDSPLPEMSVPIQQEMLLSSV
jgi:hypothetical protein